MVKEAAVNPIQDLSYKWARLLDVPADSDMLRARLSDLTSGVNSVKPEFYLPENPVEFEGRVMSQMDRELILSS